MPTAVLPAFISNQPILAIGNSALFAEWLTAQRASRMKSADTRWRMMLFNQEKETIRIETVRELQAASKLGLRLNEGMDIVFLWAELLSEPAQQALLKLLESPPAMTKYWLVTYSTQAMLPTIQSRCITQLLPVETPTAVSTLFGLSTTEFLALISLDKPGKLLDLATKMDRASALTEVESLLRILNVSQSAVSIRQQQACIQALDSLDANSHIGLTLDTLFLQLWLAEKQAKHP